MALHLPYEVELAIALHKNVSFSQDKRSCYRCWRCKIEGPSHIYWRAYWGVGGGRQRHIYLGRFLPLKARRYMQHKIPGWKPRFAQPWSDAADGTKYVGAAEGRRPEERGTIEEDERED